MTALVESDADYAHLPAARARLEDAVHRLVGEVVEYVDGRILTAPSMFAQLEDAVFPGSGGDSQRGRPGRTPPVWIDALQLADEITTASLCWSRGSSTAARLFALTGQTWKVEDCKRIGQLCDALEQWRAQIDALLNPPARWSSPNPCPACGTAVVHRIQDGERVRTAALQIGPKGCECQRCRTTWSPERFVWLSRVF